MLDIKKICSAKKYLFKRREGKLSLNFERNGKDLNYHQTKRLVLQKILYLAR